MCKALAAAFVELRDRIREEQEVCCSGCAYGFTVDLGVVRQNGRHAALTPQSVCYCPDRFIVAYGFKKICPLHAFSATIG